MDTHARTLQCALRILEPYFLNPLYIITYSLYHIPHIHKSTAILIISKLTGILTFTLLAGLPSNTIGVIVIVWQLPCWSLLSTPLFLGINCIDTWGKCKDGRNVVYLLNLRIDKTFTLFCSGVRIFANNTLLGTSHIMIVHNPCRRVRWCLIQK